MSWRDKFRQGKLGKASFIPSQHEYKGGQRLVVTEFPLRDEHDIQKMGRKAGEGTFDCFVLRGPAGDYMYYRDAMLAELDNGETLDLVHPWLGSMRIEIQSYSLRETTEEGGKAAFSINWVRAANTKQAKTIRDTRYATRASGSAANTAVAKASADIIKTRGKPAFVKADLLSRVSKALSAISGAMSPARSMLSTYSNQLGAVESVSGQAGSLISDPLSLCSSITGLVGGIGSVADSPISALRQYRTLFSHGNDDPVRYSGTASREQQAANARAVNWLVQRAAIIAAAVATASMEFASRDDAIAVRDEISAHIDAAAETADDDTYSALMDLRGSMSTDITTRAADLSKLRTVTPRATMPGLVLAYRLYDDIGREGEIIARNRLAHPGFVAGGRPLEVLNG